MGNMKDIGLLDCEDRPSIEENLKRVAKNHGYIGKEEKTKEFDPKLEDGILDGFPAFKVGDTVNVKVDGIEYSLTAFDDGGGFIAVGDNYGELEGGTGKYGWQIFCQGERIAFYAKEPHTVSWKVPKYHPLDHKFLPKGYPYVETEWKEVSVPSLEEDVPILEGFPTFSVGDTVEIKVDGIAYSLVAFQDDEVIVVGDSNSDLFFGTPKYGWLIVCMGGGVVKMASIDPCTLSWKVQKVHPIDPEFLPEGIGGGGSMKFTVENVTVNSNSGRYAAQVTNLCYEDGTPVTYSTALRLTEAMYAGMTCYVYCQGRRVGEILSVSATETSDGYTAVINGICSPISSFGEPAGFNYWG